MLQCLIFCRHVTVFNILLSFFLGFLLGYRGKVDEECRTV